MFLKSFIFFALAFLVSCASTNNIALNKLAPALRKQVLEHQKDSSNDLISFIGKTKVPIDSTIENDMKAAGLQINSTSQNIFTGKGSYKEILKILDKDYIKSLEANKTLAPNVTD